MYQYLLKPVLFLFSPERAHQLTVFLLRLTLSIPGISHFFRAIFRFEGKRLEREVMGIHFSNPVGLAAGFDKDGKYIQGMAALGFGFVELGTVTPLPQGGNPKPRLFRLPEDRALINRMGFNNEGVEALVRRLQQLQKPSGLVIGGNIGKNKDTPNENAASDYLICFEALFPYVDYFVVNVSSPNTPGLRALQDKTPLTVLLSKLQESNAEKPHPKPILLKIAPDLSDAQLDDILEIARETKLAGVIATNTTIGRADLRSDPVLVSEIGAGGLSGKPLKQRATEVIRYLHLHSGGQLVIIGVGGIESPEDAVEKIAAGAALVQIYTGLIYEGPMLVRKIKKHLWHHF